MRLRVLHWLTDRNIELVLAPDFTVLRLVRLHIPAIKHLPDGHIYGTPIPLVADIGLTVYRPDVICRTLDLSAILQLNLVDLERLGLREHADHFRRATISGKNHVSDSNVPDSTETTRSWDRS